MHNIRATGSYIRGTNGSSNGIVPMLRVFNDTGELALSWRRRAPGSQCGGVGGCREGPAEQLSPANLACVVSDLPRLPPTTCLPAPLCSPLRGPGRRQAQGCLCHVLRALARRHLRLAVSAPPRPLLLPLLRWRCCWIVYLLPPVLVLADRRTA
jgi:hypothetical protein